MTEIGGDVGAPFPPSVVSEYPSIERLIYQEVKNQFELRFGTGLDTSDPWLWIDIHYNAPSEDSSVSITKRGKTRTYEVSLDWDYIYAQIRNRYGPPYTLFMFPTDERTYWLRVLESIEQRERIAYRDDPLARFLRLERREEEYAPFLPILLELSD